MSLDTSALKSNIKAAFLSQRNKTDNPENAIDNLAEQIAQAVDTYVKSMQITYTTGLANSGGPVTGTFEYIIT